MRRLRGIAAQLGLGAAAAIVLAAAPAAQAEPALPPGFQDSVVFEDLQEPTALRFSPDGRVFIAEKSGEILLFDNLGDETPTVFADLRPQVYDTRDRGLLSLALDPDFPTSPYVYALYTFDHVLGEDAPGAFPRWGEPPDYEGDPNPCPGLSGGDVDACPVSGRLVRLTVEGDHAAEEGGAPLEDVLVEDWCQQNSSHSIGDLEFGPEGALFASGGDGASFTTADYGQFGWPHKNQCGDARGAVGEELEPPDAEGGALRSQDVRTLADPTGLDGSVIRVNPATGAGLPDNPFASSLDPNARRIVGFGFRNPFRLAINDETDEIYVNNVGGGPIEEIDRLSTTPSPALNSGWPCFEGMGPNLEYELLGLDACESLYEAPGSTSQPFFSYSHYTGVTPEDENCPTANGSAISGSTFYEGASFPSSYQGAFFFADAVFGCIYLMFPDEHGRPDPSTVVPFLTDGGLYPGVDIQVGPGGDLYYVQLFGAGYGPGSVHRISYFSGNQPPVARLTASPKWGPAPLEAEFVATGSTDADGEGLLYEWDLDDDGVYEAPTASGEESENFSDSQNHRVAVRVSDEQGASSVARVTVYPGDTPPDPVIVNPVEDGSSGKALLEWGVGQPIDFDGEAEDDEDGPLAATSFDWSTRLYHCPSGPESCHAHPLQAFPSVDAATLIAPDHDYPSHIELTLTATDSRGLSATTAIEIYPRTVELEIASLPLGVTLTAGPLTGPGPFTLTSIEGSKVTLVAPKKAQLGPLHYDFEGWSDEGSRVHTIVANAPGQYTAAYVVDPERGPPKEEPKLNDPKPDRRRVVFSRRPSKRSEGRAAHFAFRLDGHRGGFRCRLDSGRFQPCRSPRVYRHLTLGWHAFRVQAVGADGTAVSRVAVFRWRVLPSPSRVALTR